MRKHVRSVKVRADLEHFRIRMRQLADWVGGVWQSSSRDCLVFKEHKCVKRELVMGPPARQQKGHFTFAFPRMHLKQNDVTPTGIGIWRVRHLSTGGKQSPGWACFKAYERPEGHTCLDFWDGWGGVGQRESDLIGTAFTEFTTWLLGQLPMSDDEQVLGSELPGKDAENDELAFLDDDMRQRLLDKHVMKPHYENYKPSTAKSILAAIPEAHERWATSDKRWGPGVIAEVCGVGSTTVGRYLKALKQEGLTKVGHISIP